VLTNSSDESSFGDEQSRALIDALPSATARRTPPPATKCDPATGMSNGSHILARGDSHLPFAQPRFGTPCAATLTSEQRQAESQHAMRMIANMNNGLLGCAIADPNVDHDHDKDPKQAGGY